MKNSTYFNFLTLLLSLASITFGYGQEEVKPKKSYITVFLSPKSNKNLSEEEVQVIDNNHLRTLGRLSENKILANAGPLDGGGEIMFLNLNSRHEAESLLAKDPLIQQGLATYEILSLEIRKGSVCDPVFPYEMVTYEFVRYSPTNQIASYKTNSDFDMKRLHEQYLKNLINSDYVIMEGTFGANDGGMLIYKSGSKDINIERDPAITNGYLVAETRKIWLNKGSFCDN